jgi:methyl-accepting chemotaxis protein
MIDIGCDRCGKRYRIDETRMKGETARVKCKSCGNPITVTKPQDVQPAESIFAEPPPAAEPQPGSARPRAATPASKPKEPEVLPDADTAAEPLYTAEKPRFGLFGKTLIVMLLLSILPFGMFWFLTFRETSERIRGDSELLLAQTGKGIADQMDAWVNANFAVLRTIAKLPDTVAMARERQEPVLQAVSREYPWMYLVFTVAPSGANIARSDGQPLAPYGDRQYFKDVMAGKAMSWQTVVGRTSNVPALVIAVPIRDDGRVVGVLAAAMTVEDISKQVATWKRGATGYAFLIDEKGNAIAHPSAQVAQKRENLNATPLIAEFRRKGWTTLTTLFTAPNGQSALGHARSNNLGWVLALQQEEREVFDSLNVLQNFALALLAVTALLAAAIAWFSARAIAKPVMKLTDAAERMSLGDLNVRIDVRSGDEIGLLAQAIARMQTSLRMAMERLRKRKSA